MPPKLDPYGNRLHRGIDVFLCILSLLMAAIVFFIAAH
jgi:hypothetical protein